MYSLNYRSKLNVLKMLQLKNFVTGNLFPKSYEPSAASKSLCFYSTKPPMQKAGGRVVLSF